MKEEAELNQTMKTALVECEKQVEKLGQQLHVQQEEKQLLVEHLTNQLLVGAENRDVTAQPIG